jgi:hypothetical protein
VRDRRETETGNLVPCRLPWAWADAFHADGRNGIVNRGPVRQRGSVALFGTAGAQPDTRGHRSESTLTLTRFDVHTDGYFLDLVPGRHRPSPGPAEQPFWIDTARLAHPQRAAPRRSGLDGWGGGW